MCLCVRWTACTVLPPGLVLFEAIYHILTAAKCIRSTSCACVFWVVRMHIQSGAVLV